MGRESEGDRSLVGIDGNRFKVEEDLKEEGWNREETLDIKKKRDFFYQINAK